MSLKSKIVSAAAVAISATMSLVAFNAQAEEAEAKTVTVKIDAFDLSKAQGAEAVYARLRNAARQVCRTLESRDVSLKKEHRECVEQALDEAVAQVNSTRLTALHRSESGIRIAAAPAATRS